MTGDEFQCFLRFHNIHHEFGWTISVPPRCHECFLVGATELGFNPLTDALNKFFIGTFGTVLGTAVLPVTMSSDEAGDVGKKN